MGSRLRTPVALLALFVAVGSLLAPPAAAGVGDDCPEPLEPHEIRRGLTGTGYTVADGRTRRSFQAEILGTLKDGLGPGRDMIVIETSGTIIEDNGGVWAGMSGSPIFFNDKLLGALAFGLAMGPATVAGVTPAYEMYKVLDYPEAPEETSSQPARVEIPRDIRRRIALTAGIETTAVGSALTQLPVPVSVSGGSRNGLRFLSDAIERERLSLIPYAGSSASSEVTASQAAQVVRPGDNLVAALSYGDITFSGIGTVTFACEGRAMAFGHPFLWEGETTMGANAATTITVVQDLMTPYELATVDEAIGAIDQDRFAGLRETMGLQPDRIPITSDIVAIDTGRSRQGRTEVVISESVPFIGFLHTLANIEMTMDEYTEGSSAMEVSIRGTDASGTEWTFSRSNMHSSEYSISEESAFDVSNVLNAIYYNRFEDVEFSSVDVRGRMKNEIEQYTVTKAFVSNDGQNYTEKQRIRSAPGRKVFVRIALKSYSGEERSVDMAVRIPRDASTDGFLEIRGGGASNEEGDICLYDPTNCTDESGRRVDSFEGLLAVLAAKPKNNELVANLRMGARNRVKAKDIEVLDQVVRGEVSIFVRIPGACCAGTKGDGGGGAMPSDPGTGDYGGGEKRH